MRVRIPPPAPARAASRGGLGAAEDPDAAPSPAAVGRVRDVLAEHHAGELLELLARLRPRSGLEDRPALDSTARRYISDS